MRSFRGRLTRGAGQPALLTGMHPRCGSQTRQGPHDVVGPPTQVPPRHVSPVVHASPSLHATPSGAGSRTQAPRLSQRLVPHRSIGAPHGVPAGAGAPGAQIPSAQASPTVHSLPSSHRPLLGGCTQFPPPSHTSSVQMLPSSGHQPPGFSGRQDDEQQSPSKTLPSSHCSPGSRVPLPQWLPKNVPLAGNGPAQSKVPVKLAPSEATLPSIVRLEQKDSEWPRAVNVPAAVSIVPVRATAPMRLQEPAKDRVVTDCAISTRHPTVETGPEVVSARTPHLPLMSAKAKAPWTAPRRNARGNARVRTSDSPTAQILAGQCVPPAPLRAGSHP